MWVSLYSCYPHTGTDYGFQHIALVHSPPGAVHDTFKGLSLSVNVDK